LGFLEKPTIEDSRIASYKFFSPKNEVILIFETDTKTVKIRGRVETNEPEIFSKDSGTVVSIICPDPYFYSMDAIAIQFSNLEKQFTFPYSNNDTSIKLTYFGNIAVDAQKDIIYTGTIPIGFVVTVYAAGSAGSITIKDLDSREEMVVDNTVITNILGAGISVGDKITISTLRGAKSAKLLRNGVNYNILAALVGSVDWILLHPGHNNIYYTVASGAANLVFNIDYQLIYEGI
jgi:hypothetical protein